MKGWCCAQVVEHLPDKCKALSLTSLQKKKKKWREEEEKSDKLYCKLRVEFERFLN
jgi:hypothetical protein